MWPSGKATGFGPVIRGFESLHPNQKFLAPHMRGYLYGLLFMLLTRTILRLSSYDAWLTFGAVFALTFTVILNNLFDFLGNDQYSEIARSSWLAYLFRK